jgi:3-isopropylmalate dehydrogenase
MLADAGGMQLVRWPKQFDVIVTDNLFGDMLSDVAAMLTGSLGMLPSASLGAARCQDRQAQGAVRAGARLRPGHRRQGIANPIAMIASFAMCLRYSFNMVARPIKVRAGDRQHVLDKGLRTGDIMQPGMQVTVEVLADRRDGRRHAKSQPPNRNPSRSIR